jgi:hypothetical protein
MKEVRWRPLKEGKEDMHLTRLRRDEEKLRLEIVSRSPTT